MSIKANISHAANPPYPGKTLLCAALIFLALLTQVLAQQTEKKLQDLAASRYDSDAVKLVSAWQQLVADHRHRSDRERLIATNDFFNQRIAFSDDLVTWRQQDYWATPLELMGLRQGDCEDFSIAKYITLQRMGIPTSKLRMTYVRARIASPTGPRTQAHMVLSYYPQISAEPLILDNLFPKIRPGSKRPDLTPVYSFNSEGLWLGSMARAVSNQPTTRLSRWRDLLKRIKQDGFE